VPSKQKVFLNEQKQTISEGVRHPATLFLLILFSFFYQRHYLLLYFETFFYENGKSFSFLSL